ncbi:uncharacterized protein LOC62_04G005307 [Vanrija pseudolonga]|uniref:Uncharacterized protein n=1 Tax=Vanrija pseudolonga TaxID=143232 RepID=A0AAF0YBP6_9TREE|nr:hypothetical protein LOC62_04G005307 [Vanrija pseudolonga]
MRTKLAFRLTSKAFSTYIDKLLFKRALLTLGIQEGEVQSRLSFPVFTAPPVPPFNNAAHFRAMEVVDVKLKTDCPGREYSLRRAVAVHTIRRIGWFSTRAEFYLQNGVRTVVDFVDAGQTTMGDPPRITISSRQERHIIHLCWRAAEYFTGFPPTFSFSLNGPSINVTETVLALWQINPNPNEPLQTDPPINVVLGIMLELQSYLRYWGTLKIVGLETLRWETEETLDFDFMVAEVRAGLRENLEALAGIQEDDLEVIDRSITFVTFEQWWQELGPRKDVEGLWNPLVRVSTA